MASSKNTFQNSSPMMRRFLLWVGHTSKKRQEALLGIHVHEIDVELVAERAHHLLGLIQTEQPMVHEHARQLVADSTMQ